MNDFVLEIGVENLPASYIEPAMAQLKGAMETLLETSRLDCDEVAVAGTGVISTQVLQEFFVTATATLEVDLLAAKAVVLATGGIRRLYEPSTGSRLCTADGISLAYRAGAKLVDMEMVQYHPSVMKRGRLALSELLFAQGVELLRADKQPLSDPSGQPWAHALARAATEEIAAGHGDDGHLLLKAGVSPEAADSTFYMTN
ncbi:MAG: FAD-binding protein, partial [Chloroflexi bacterium]|nr:FAD-binding protein [Chloroflexota bacterium]